MKNEIVKNDVKFHFERAIPTFCGMNPMRFAHTKSIESPEGFFLHLNNHLEIYIFLDGDAKFIVEDKIYALTPGDIVLINPREVHKVLLSGQGIYERAYLIIPLRTFESMEIDPTAAISSRIPGESNLLSLSESKKEREFELLVAIENSLRAEDRLSAFADTLLFLNMIREGLAEKKPPRGTKGQGTPALLKAIFDYVSANAATIGSIGEIARAVGRTPQYISGYFSSETGTTLQKYIQAKKIALAKNMLDEGADVTSACYDCGFGDCSYFIKVFKSYVGVTPLCYKNGGRREDQSG